MSCAETDEPIDLPFGLRIRVGGRKHKFNRIRQVRPMCPPMGANWRHLANTIEPSVYCGDAVSCQITLTTCFYSATVHRFRTVYLELTAYTHPLSRQIVNLQTSTKVSSLPVRFCRLVTLCQRLRLVLRFWRYIN